MLAMIYDSLGPVRSAGLHHFSCAASGSPQKEGLVMKRHIHKGFTIVELLVADVLRDLIDLGEDPETGEHLYLALIEW